MLFQVVMSLLHSLDHCPPVGLQADLQLLQDLTALLQLGGVSVWKGPVMNGEAPQAVRLQQGGHSVLIEFSSGAENKHLLHALILKLLCQQDKNKDTEMNKRHQLHTRLLNNLDLLTNISFKAPADIFVSAT